MKNQILILFSLMGLLFFTACSNSVSDDMSTSQHIKAEGFFQKNKIEMAAVEINGDGNQDILITGSNIAEMKDLNGDGNQDILITGSNIAEMKDINGDGNQDILITGSGTTKMRDANGDGNQDILITGSSFKLADNDDDSANRDVLITIPPHAFLTPSNEPITGKIILKLALLPTKNDVIFSGLDSRAESGALLNSSAILHVNATQNGQQLKINPEYLQHSDAGIMIELFNLDQPVKNLSIYTGDKEIQEPRSLLSSPNRRWKPSEKPDSLREESNGAVKLNLTHLGWLNIAAAAFDTTAQKPITVNVQGEGLEKLKDLRLWLVWEKKNITIKLNPFDKNGTVWTSSDNNVPDDENPVLAVMGISKNGNLVMGKAKAKLEKDGVYSVIVE